MIHHYGHYGSSHNAPRSSRNTATHPTPTSSAWYGGITGPLSNIRQDGAMYNGFHSFTDALRDDAKSGDYGPNFLGVMFGSGVYVIDDPELGLVTYGGKRVCRG